MADYYCKLCEVKHSNTIENVYCPNCESSYCLSSIENVISAGMYDCPSCNYSLENFHSMPLILKKKLKTVNLPKHLVKVISAIIATDGSLRISLTRLSQKTNMDLEIVEKTLKKLMDEGKIQCRIEKKSVNYITEKIMLVLAEGWNVQEINKERELIKHIKDFKKKKQLIKIRSYLKQLLELSIISGEKRKQWEYYQSDVETQIEEAEVLSQLENLIQQSIPEVRKFNTTIFGFNTQNNRIQCLNLSSQELKSLPSSIEKFQELKKLYLEFNKVKSLPETLGNLTNLKILRLSNNHLTSLPESLGNLVELKDLHVGENLLNNFPKSVLNLKRLTNLYLNHNQLTTLPNSIGILSNLKKLNLYDNQIVSLPMSLGNLKSLQRLDFGLNHLTSLPESIGNLTNLKELKLGGNRLSFLPESIGNLTNLSLLDISENQLASLPNSVSNLLNLKYLYLDKELLNNQPEILQYWINQLKKKGCYFVLR